MARTSYPFTRPNGCADADPIRASMHRWIEQTLLTRFEAYGYRLVNAPTLEYADLYHWSRIGTTLFHQLLTARISESRTFPSHASGDEEGSESPLLHPTANTSDVSYEVVLRPDLTAPLARAYISSELGDTPPSQPTGLKDDVSQTDESPPSSGPRALPHKGPLLPERRSYAGQVFRNLKPGPGRLKEFRQVGGELVGSEDPLADLEILFMACDATQALGIPEWTLHLGHAKLYRSILESQGVRDGAALGAIGADLEQLARDSIAATAASARALQYMRSRCGELLQTEDHPPPWMTKPDGVDVALLCTCVCTHVVDRIRARWHTAWGLTDDTIETILGMAYLPADPTAFFDSVDPLCHTEETRAYVEHLRDLSQALSSRGVSVRMTPAAGRGIGYYTGITFEIHTPQAIGPYSDVCGGGRYDDLYPWIQDRSIRTARSARGASVSSSPLDGDSPIHGRSPAISTRQGRLSAIGLAFGIERITEALREVPPSLPATLDVFVAVQDERLTRAAFELATELRDAGFRVRAHLNQPGQRTGLGEQLGIAHHLDVPFTVILGEDELAAGEVSVKSMASQTQVRVPRVTLPQFLKHGLPLSEAAPTRRATHP